MVNIMAKSPSRPAGVKGSAQRPALRKTAAVADKKTYAVSRNADLELTVTALDDEGFGTARIEGTIVKIGGTIPGDVLVVRVDHAAHGLAFAHVKRMITPSPLRSRRPPCRESNDCLGCPLIAMKYTEQLVWKRGLMLSELARHDDLKGVPVLPPLAPDNLIHYRTTAKLTVAGKFSNPFIGIYRRATHDVYDLDDCALHHPLINRVVAVARRGITSLKVPIYNPHSKMGLLRYLVVRVSVSEKTAMVVFVTAQRSYNEIHHLARYMQKEMPEIKVVAQNVNSSEGNVIMGSKDHFLTTQHHLTERIGEVAFRISPRSFFQVNNSGARLIYSTVREWSGLTGQETVLDVYCGIGGIALYLADRARQVIGIEVVQEAVADAAANARLNRRDNCRFEAGDAAELLEELADELETVDVAVLNPPRKGCDAEVLKRVVALAPRTILYVSCSPSSLARDLALLAPLGYVCREIQPVDMFPQTVHVENVARLENIDKNC